MKLYLRNWIDSFFDELTRTKHLRIISPFIQEHIIRKIENSFNFNNFELVTRFNLNDFACNISSLNALKFTVEQGGSVFGIRDLHSKVYLFDNRAAIITSANLTSGGLKNNLECGVFTTEKVIINELQNYFLELKNMANNSLTIIQCDKWEKLISDLEVHNNAVYTLPDFGSSQFELDNTISYHIKFLGTNDNRVPHNFTAREEIQRSLCHYACGFSKRKKPRKIKQGDIIYFSRMTTNPWDHAIFGRAEALTYVEDRDKASAEEIIERPWKQHWPVYLRVKNPIFLDGKMEDFVTIYELIDTLNFESFASTRRRYENGEREIDPYRSLRQQAYITLTHKAAEWLEPRFQIALKRLGKVPDSFINSLPQSIKINE